MQKHNYNKDKKQSQNAKPNYERAGFVRQDKYVLQYVPQEPPQPRGGRNNQRIRQDYDEEDKNHTYNDHNSHQAQRQRNYNNHGQNKQYGGQHENRYHEDAHDDFPYSTTASESKGQNRRGGYQQSTANKQGRQQHQTRGLDPHQQNDNYEQEGHTYQGARFASRGRGRGRGGNSHHGRDFNGFGQPVDFQETRTRTRGRGRGRGQAVPTNRDYSNQWLKDDAYDDENDDEDLHDEGKEQQQYYRLQSQSSNVADDEIFRPKYFLNDQRDFEELFEEKCIHDKRSMQMINQYNTKLAGYFQPEFFQGPQYVMYKQPSSQNRKQRIQSSEMGDIQFQNKEKFERDQQRSHYNANARFEKEDKHKYKEVYGQVFDFKQEKRTENQFWNNPVNDKKKQIKHQKDQKNVIVPRNNRQKIRKSSGGKKQYKSDTGKDKFFKKNNNYQDNRNNRQTYEDHLSEQQIKEGLKLGYLFEGILRVNQNNRKRAFVHIDDIKFDVMIDGLIQQNRALDGDTVIISLLDPSRWMKYTSNNVVVGKDSMGQSKLISTITAKGYTNETAIETRVIDIEEIIVDEEVVDPKARIEEELKEIQEEIKQNLSAKKELSFSSDSSSSQQSDQESEELKEYEKHADEDNEDVGYNMLEDEVVSSSSEEEEEAKTPKQNLQMIKEESTQSAKRERQQYKGNSKQQDTKTLITKSKNPFYGKSKQEIIAEINRIAQDLRPMGIVRGIVKSPNREKDHLVTLIKAESMEFDDKQLQDLINLHDHKKNAISTGIYAVPVSKKLPWMALFNVPAELIQDIKNKKKISQRYYIVKMNPWKAHAYRPACTVLTSIGEAGNLDAESMRLLKMHDIWSDEYETEGQKISEKVDESLRIFTKDIDLVSGEWIIPQEEIDRRVDLRNKRIFTIDPITAKDLDDALSIEKVSEFVYEIGVHIADVSYFVQQGTELDKEAQLRCTSVYFVHKVYPMLPRLLCERLCSLNPKVDRLAYSIFFRMDIRNGELDKSYTPRICRTVIRSCAKWHYQLVQDILDGKITQESQLEDQYKPINGVKFNEMRDDCFLMNEIAQKRRKKRLENGSILLQNREFCFALDQESKMPLGFQESYRIESKFLVEEYMLLANILIAEHLHQYCKDKTLLRCHPDVEDEKKTKLKEFFEKVGLSSIDLTDSQTLSVSLETLRDSGDSAKFNVAMRKFLTCLQCAKYMCINEAQEREYMHFGLNFPLYTHFTSPIRRYADLLVHRLVTLTLQHKESTRDLIELMDYSNYADMCSEKSYNAKRASQQCTRLFHCLLLKSNGVKVFETLLFDMDQGSISIYIDEVNMHQKLRLRDDARIESLVFFEEQMTLVAKLKPSRQDAKQNGKKNEERLDRFKKAKTIFDIESEFAANEYLTLRIFDKIKVKVDTTTEFPLDIVCTLLFTEEDEKEYQILLKQAEDKAEKVKQDKLKAAQEVVINEMENLNDEV